MARDVDAAKVIPAVTVVAGARASRPWGVHKVADVARVVDAHRATSAVTVVADAGDNDEDLPMVAKKVVTMGSTFLTNTTTARLGHRWGSQPSPNRYVSGMYVIVALSVQCTAHPDPG